SLRRLGFAACVVVATSPGASSQDVAVPAAETVARPFAGVVVRCLTRAEPRPLRVHVAEIALAEAGVRFFVTPGNGDPNGPEPGDPNGETTRQTTLDFLREQHAQLAVNGTFFDMERLGTDNKGLVVSAGDQISPFHRNWPALNLDQRNAPAIVRGTHDTFALAETNKGVELFNALAGSDQIVTNGRATTDQREFSLTLHPRTAAGFTADGRLILIVVDGRQPGYSEGVSLAELASLMLEYGCQQALNLDGGGSTTLAIADPEPRVLNSPSGKDEQGNFGTLRKTAANLAVFASPASP
ncbi:MAG: phosphodiester glycosidase family protein, partial [Planctomycetales bacterium]|nr:phosphodiester glycosidase family protein [Planctomycetales bacterium]